MNTVVAQKIRETISAAPMESTAAIGEEYSKGKLNIYTGQYEYF